MKQKKKQKQNKASKKSTDFTLEDIVNAPKRLSPKGIGCTHCGSVNFIYKDQVKIFRRERLKVYHCHDCGQDFYKGE